MATVPGADRASSVSTLPAEVVHCLQNARFLHLATCQDQTPHVSLMSYTYLPSTPYSPQPTIIMTTLPSSRKTTHLLSNPRVSILVHDWVSHRPPTLGTDEQSGNGTSGRTGRPSGLASLLFNLNSASLSRISVSINGLARVLAEGSEEEAWHQARHKEHNTFGDMAQNPSMVSQDDESSGGAGAYIEAQEGRTVVVEIQDGRISDWKGSVRDFVMGSDQTEELTEVLTNGM